MSLLVNGLFAQSLRYAQIKAFYSPPAHRLDRDTRNTEKDRIIFVQPTPAEQIMSSLREKGKF